MAEPSFVQRCADSEWMNPNTRPPKFMPQGADPDTYVQDCLTYQEAEFDCVEQFKNDILAEMGLDTEPDADELFWSVQKDCRSCLEVYDCLAAIANERNGYVRTPWKRGEV